MSHTIDEWKQLLRQYIPKLDYNLRKGDMGRIAIIGGSEEYSGAPYFSAISALKVGADLVHIFCEQSAGPIIKSYCPELIVHPYLVSSASLTKRGIGGGTDHASSIIKEAAHKVNDWLQKIDVILIGPGLSRDGGLMRCVREIVRGLHDHRRIPLIFDGDGIWFIQNNPYSVIGYDESIATPNFAEYNRLKKTFELDEEDDELSLSKKLGGTRILHKGSNDIFANSETKIELVDPGCPRRCGGQGDVLGGLLATFICWFIKGNVPQPYLHASVAASILLKSASNKAYASKGRSMITADVINEIGASFQEVFE